MILYFTGTGNTYYMARKLAAITGEKLVSMNELLKTEDYSDIDAAEVSESGAITEGNLIFALPTYAWRIPNICEQWIRKVNFINAKNVYFVISCGGDAGNAKKYIKRLCEDKNFNYMGTTYIKMPDNYIIMFKAPTKEESLKIIGESIPTIEKVGEMIKTGQPIIQNKTNLMGVLGSNLFNVGFTKTSVNDKKFCITGDCIHCNKCANVCPCNNILVEDNGPVWQGKCTQCMACISSCPIGIIEYGKSTVGKVKYLCPTDEEITDYLSK